ncbi:MAG TPA: AbrB/MazE/SpoVT family DNA-binding domain-containing protein [Nanoarchaeota archaeon]|nr:AbrB/MazE/SpoVT family DNA-binding domain-containing protein [Candidatus Woesearchaeota archaeon]HIH15295.1 AbrB/MazE/SpoVT family DNA-binding domain-containing protein [Nanoarchaeota archaeon]HIH58550.1 AbrB/MazE/SpoVT family DNA-binding domain-containing protein [Nanoarchaeota archaeon]HII14199.1 AbrB/MazE/SpoVT family DNA-binding domain-containing protein [Nanoarchaeota archaeon]HIJ05121.1 AbrB/MazE/SpoVT family DNA-binding domain-containing protein [Nanoarchaeota archaeon]
MGISIITRNYQLTLPKDVREMKNFKRGDKVLFVVQEDIIQIKKVSKNLIQETAGLWKGLEKTGIEYQKDVRKGWKKRSY